MICSLTTSNRLVLTRCNVWSSFFSWFYHGFESRPWIILLHIRIIVSDYHCSPPSRRVRISPPILPKYSFSRTPVVMLGPFPFKSLQHSAGFGVHTIDVHISFLSLLHNKQNRSPKRWIAHVQIFGTAFVSAWISRSSFVSFGVEGCPYFMIPGRSSAGISYELGGSGSLLTFIVTRVETKSHTWCRISLVDLKIIWTNLVSHPVCGYSFSSTELMGLNMWYSALDREPGPIRSWLDVPDHLNILNNSKLLLRC